MSIDDIEAIANRAARDAARHKRTPYVFYSEEEVRTCAEGRRAWGIPFLGPYVPPGWEKVGELFCDASGWGSEDEPALTQRQLAQKIIGGLNGPDTLGYGTLSAGQFQVMIGVYRRLPGGKVRERLCRKCRLPQRISGDHSSTCTWHPSRRR